jgi:hypothetical protein
MVGLPEATWGKDDKDKKEYDDKYAYIVVAFKIQSKVPFQILRHKLISRYHLIYRFHYFGKCKQW